MELGQIELPGASPESVKIWNRTLQLDILRPKSLGRATP